MIDMSIAFLNTLRDSVVLVRVCVKRLRSQFLVLPWLLTSLFVTLGLVGKGTLE